MPTYGQDLSRFNLTQLRALTGRGERTLRKRLAGLAPVSRDGRTVWYPARAALEAIYIGDALDPTRERARLDRARAERQELELAARRGELVPADDQQLALIALATVVKQRVLAIGASCAPELAEERTAAGCQAIVDRETRAALEDLAAAGEM